MNGHYQTGTIGPFGAKSSLGRRALSAALRLQLLYTSEQNTCLKVWLNHYRNPFATHLIGPNTTSQNNGTGMSATNRMSGQFTENNGEIPACCSASLIQSANDLRGALFGLCAEVVFGSSFIMPVKECMRSSCVPTAHISALSFAI
jgi:hypothetical protein